MNIAKVLLTQVVAAVAAPVAVAPAVVMTIRQILALILVMNMPHGIKVHAVVHGHTVIRVILAIMAVAAVVQNAPAVIHTVAAMVQTYIVVINHVPRHVHGRHAHLMRPVHTAVHQPAVHNITVVHAVHRLQHVQSAYRVIPAITKAAAAVRHAVAINIIAPVEPARVYHLGIIPQAAHPPPEQVKRNVAVINIIAVVVCAIVYRLGIIQRVAHPPPEQVKQPVAVINIIAVVVCARVYRLGIIQRAEVPPPEQVKSNAPPAHIAVVELNTIARLAIPTLPPVQMLWKTARYHVQQAR